MLGVANVRRNFSRSLLSVVSMAVAAMVLSTALHLAAGYPAVAFVPQRVFAGGDIMIFPRTLSLAGAGGNGMGPRGADAVFDRLDRDWITELFAYNPEAYDYGVFLGAGRSWFVWDEIKGRLEGLDYLADVYPYLVLPAYETSYNHFDGYWRGGLAAVRGRNIAKDLNLFYFQDYIVAGRPLSEPDVGRARAVIDAGRAFSAGYGAPGQFAGSFSGNLELRIPRLVPRAGPDGEAAGPLFDYSQAQPHSFRLVGGYQFDDDEDDFLPPYSTPQVIVPDDYFFTLWDEVSGGRPVMVPQVSVSVANMATLETVAARLRADLPDCTVVTVARAASQGRARGGLPERWSDWRRQPGDLAVVAGGVALPPQVKYVSLALTSLLAALVVAANNLVLLSQRRREIGVLRAIGAAARDVMSMVLAEVATVSIIGAVIGYGLVRAFVVWNQISGRISLATVGASVVLDGAKVVGLCLAAGLVFGLLPAVRSTRVSTMEVLRGE